jgi:hypothetical protein
MSGIGHNGGPTMEPGFAWRRHAWGAARERLLPHLPIEVLRGRLRRAAELGLDYRTYASVRAASGQDVVAVLFSSNALRAALGRDLPPDRLAKLAAVVGAGRIGLAAPPLAPPALLAAAQGALDAADTAPGALARWRDARERLRAILGRVPGDRALLVGAFDLERDWCAAGNLAGYVPAERYFGP